MKTIVLFLLFQFACIAMASWAWGWLFDDPIATGTREWSTVVTIGCFVLMAVAFFVFGDRFMAELVKRKWIVPVVFLALCLSTSAAPLPPFPTVKRPAPLLSPKDIAISSGAMKGSPMFRFTPASVGYDVPGLAPTLPPTFQTNLTIIQIDGSEVQRDLARVIAKQRVGKGIRVEYTDGVPSSTGTWEFLADWAPYVEESIVVTERYTDPAFRQQARFFRVVEYNGTALRVASGSPVRLNPAIRELRSFRIIVPKK